MVCQSRRCFIVMLALGWLAIFSPETVRAKAPDLSAVLANDDAVSRLRELEPYVKSLRPEEVPAALKKAIAGHGPGREDAIDALAGRGLEIDAPAVLAFARQTSDREARETIFSAYYGDWAERDPDAALEAANKAGAGEHSEAIWEIAHKIGMHDPQRASDLIKIVHNAKMQDSDYFIFWCRTKKDLKQTTQTLLEDAKVAGISYPCESATWAITDRLFDDDPVAAADWVMQLPPGKVHDEAFDELVSRWEKVNCEAVATWLETLPDSGQVKTAISNLPEKTVDKARARVKVDPAFAKKVGQLDKILWESNCWLELEALLPFVDGLTSAEFPQALEHFCNIPDSNRDKVLDVLIVRWAKVDPAGVVKAIPMVDTIYDSEFSERFLTDVYGAWAERDPEAAFADATRGWRGYGDYESRRVILAALARKDPAKAYASFKKSKDPNSHLLVTPVFIEWAVRDLPSATKALTDEANWQGAVEGIVIGLMRKGPSAAVAWAEHLPDKARSARALADVALRWPDDPAAAMAWLEKYPDFEGKDTAFDDVAVDWAIRDTIEALGHATALPDGPEKKSLLNWGLAQLTYDDAEAAQRFARLLPGDETKKQALKTVVDYWSEYDPTAAADFLSSIAKEATPGDVASIAWSLSYHDPASAVKWLDALPASADKAPATEKIAENWHQRDAPATEAWVNQLPEGPLRDAGAHGICTSLYGQLVPALHWARMIHDPKIRHDAVYHAYEQGTSWRSMGFVGDTKGIEDEINGAPELTDADRKALIARLPRMVVIPNPQPIQKPQHPADH